MLRWVSFSPSKTQLPSVLPLCFLHPMTGKMFPLSLLAVPLLPFCYLSIWPSLLCSVAKRVILLSPPTHTRTSVSVRNERGENYRTVCIFPELLKSALMLMADHVHQSAWTFLTHTYTQRHANLHVNSSKRHLVARRLVLSICVCVLGCV